MNATQADAAPQTVDAFILFNESEDSVVQVVNELSSQGITTYFWRRDISPGEAWEETEQERLSAAGTVVVFLGEHGWGPTHLRLTIRAQGVRKRIIPVLIGNPPSDAFREAGGIFERLRYVDLRDQSAASSTMLVEAIRPRERTGQFAGIIGQLIDGNEEQRSEVLQQIIKGTFLDKRGLSNRLRDEIQNRFGPEQERRFASAVRDPKKMPSVRSWMLSALIWADTEYPPNRQLVLKHLQASFEAERSVRFWAFAGLLHCRASYLRNAIETCQSDPAPEVSWLARAIARPDDTEVIGEMRSMLFSDDFERGAWPVLRVLRVLNRPGLIGGSNS